MGINKSDSLYSICRKRVAWLLLDIMNFAHGVKNNSFRQELKSDQYNG